MNKPAYYGSLLFAGLLLVSCGRQAWFVYKDLRQGGLQFIPLVLLAGTILAMLLLILYANSLKKKAESPEPEEPAS